MSETTEMTDAVEVVARAIANEIGPSFDDAYANKAEWIDDRGKRADINAPFKSDYISAAQSALTALESLGFKRVPEGWQIVPKEPTDEMLLQTASTHIRATGENWADYVEIGAIKKVYASMLSSAPKGEA